MDHHHLAGEDDERGGERESFTRFEWMISPVSQPVSQAQSYVRRFVQVCTLMQTYVPLAKRVSPEVIAVIIN